MEKHSGILELPADSGLLGKTIMLQMKSKLTVLTGTDIQCSSQGAILSYFHVSAETPVVWVDCRGGQSGLLEGEAVHLNSFQIQCLLIGC